MLSQTAVEQFKTKLRGELIEPDSPKYETARKVYNAMIDRRPRMIARCADVADVIECVNFGRDNGLLIAVRGGGHNAGGLGVWDDALVIDLSAMRYTHVDPDTQTVRVGGGATWGDVDHATHAFGLAVPTGIISTTGVAGLTLGGGLGHLTRKCGLTIDNLLAADVVLADGSFVTANEWRNEDLFWALKGGGGNFGVVTSFVFKAHPVHTDYAGPMLWEMDRAPEIMRWYRDFIVNAPNELNGFFAFMTVPPAPIFPEKLHLKKMCAIIWCYAGDAAEGEKALVAARQLNPVLDMVGPIPHPVLNSMFDGLYVPGLQWYWKADFVNELSDEAIAVHMKHAPNLPTMFSTMHLYPIDGVAHKVANEDTAWAYRNAHWGEVIVGVDPDPAKKNELVEWTRSYWEELHPFSAGGAYVNMMMMDEGEDRVRASYGANYDRLAAIKAKYDPNNLFRINQNIKPKEMDIAHKQAG